MSTKLYIGILLIAGEIFLATIIIGLNIYTTGTNRTGTEMSELIEPENNAAFEAGAVLAEANAEGELPMHSYTSRVVALPGGAEVTLTLPEPFSVAVAAEGLGKARLITQSPDGRIFIPDMVDYNLSRDGRVLILSDFNEATQRFETVATYLENLRGPNNVAFYTDRAGNNWLYLTLTEHLVRYPYRPGDTVPSGEPEVVYTFPNRQSGDATGIVWHLTRTALFGGDRLYVSVGSGCNSCEQAPGEMRAMILSMNPEGEDVEVVADGMRNAVGLVFVDDAFYATNNGSDHLGAELPLETLYRIEEGSHYGWPYCYEAPDGVVRDTTQGWQRPVDCALVPRALTIFPARSAPLGLEFFGASTLDALRNMFLVALHGSFNVSIGSGYEVAQVSPVTGKVQSFITGFLNPDGTRAARPVDIKAWSDRAFLLTDDYNGVLYYVYAEPR
jgi:glucose/arabinose dehydrogenase